MTQIGGLAYCVWEVYSWDVMEPFCYFLGLSVAWTSYFYFAKTKTNAAYGSMKQRFMERKRLQMYGRVGFDPVKFAKLETAIGEAEDEVHVLQYVRHARTLAPLRALAHGRRLRQAPLGCVAHRWSTGQRFRSFTLGSASCCVVLFIEFMDCSHAHMQTHAHARVRARMRKPPYAPAYANCAHRQGGHRPALERDMVAVR